jgi:hypothetical protein
MNNYFDVIRGGVVIRQAINNSTLIIDRNDISVGDIRTDPHTLGYGGVWLDGCNFQRSNPGMVENNRIKLTNGYIAGVEEWSCSNVSVINNTISLTPVDLPPFTRSHGITLRGSNNGLLVSQNDVSSVMPQGVAPILSRGFYHTSSQGAIYCCNSVHGTNEGMTMEGVSMLTDFFWTNFQGSLDADLHYLSTGLTGPIGDNDFNPNNRWTQGTGISIHDGNSEQFIFASRHFSNPFTPPTLPPDIQTPNAPNADWFVQGDADADQSCPTEEDCGFGNASDIKIDDTDIKIAKRDWDGETVFQPTLQWRAERYLLAKLEDNPGLIDDDVFVEQFYDNMQGSTADLFNDVEREIALLDTVATSQSALYRSNLDSIFRIQEEIAGLDSIIWDTDSLDLPPLQADRSALVAVIATLTYENDSLFAIVTAKRVLAAQLVIVQNDSITVSEIFEENEKIANDIYLRTIVQGIDTFTQTQFELLDAIVWQCPLRGGNAVYKARGMYLMEVDTVFEDDESVCDLIEERGVNKKAAVYQPAFRLHPNPANRMATLLLEKSGNVPLQVVLTNLYGKPVLRSSIPEGQRQFVLEVQDIPSGFYMCRVYRGEEDSFTQKLLVIH